MRRALALAGLLVAAPACAQTQLAAGVPAAGHGSMALTFQHSTIRRRTVPELFGGGLEEFGEITLRSAWLELDYGLTDRVALTAWLPFKSNRYRGDRPHDPFADLDDPHGERFLDDGDFHSGWGDAGVGVRWRWRASPVAIVPFASFHVPVRDYPLYTETQAGTGQWRLDVGVNAGGRFPGRARNVYWQAGYAYSYLQRTDPDDAPARRVNHGVLSVEVGWLVRPDLTLRVDGSYLRTYNGLKFPDEFVLPPRGDQFYYHDRLFEWEAATASVGVVKRFGERYAVSASYGRTVRLVWGHEYDRSWSVGISRSF
jgi:hypothetical protein